MSTPENYHLKKKKQEPETIGLMKWKFLKKKDGLKEEEMHHKEDDTRWRRAAGRQGGLTFSTQLKWHSIIGATSYIMVFNICVELPPVQLVKDSTVIVTDLMEASHADCWLLRNISYLSWFSPFIQVYIQIFCQIVMCVSLRHRGGRIQRINAWYLNTHMVYL